MLDYEILHSLTFHQLTHNQGVNYMARLSNSIQIDAPKAQVWSILADLGGIYKFHPAVKKSYYTTDAKEGVDAGRICEFHNGLKIDETALAWDNGHSMTIGIEFLAGPKPPFLSNFSGTMIVSEAPNGGTIVRMELDWDTHAGPLGWGVSNFMAAPQFGKMVPAILQGLKHHAETGEIVEGAVAKQVRQLAVATA